MYDTLSCSKSILTITEFLKTAQKMKFSIKDFFSKCDQNLRKLRIWLHSLKKSLIEIFIFSAVKVILRSVSYSFRLKVLVKHFSCHRSIRSQMFVLIGVLKNFAIFTGKHHCCKLFLTGLKARNFIKKRLQQICFAISITKFLRTSVFVEHSASVIDC